MREYFERMLAATSAEGVWDIHLARMRDYGFDRLIYCRSFETGLGSLQSTQDVALMASMPQAYINRFLQDQSYLYAPMMLWTDSIGTAQPWNFNKAQGGSHASKLQKVVALNQQFGVHAGYSIGFGPTAPYGKATIAMIANPALPVEAMANLWDKHGREIAMVNDVAHRCMTTLPWQSVRRPLTRRQCEALQLVGEGCTTRQIAATMGLSTVTVEKHLRLARQTLNARTTTQAVLKASVQNLIFLKVGRA